LTVSKKQEVKIVDVDLSFTKWVTLVMKVVLAFVIAGSVTGLTLAALLLPLMGPTLEAILF